MCKGQKGSIGAVVTDYMQALVISTAGLPQKAKLYSSKPGLGLYDFPLGLYVSGNNSFTRNVNLIIRFSHKMPQECTEAHLQQAGQRQARPEYGGG